MTIDVTIPITDDGDSCKRGYNVRYKPTSSSGWTVMPLQLTAPIFVPGLQPSTIYDYEISRVCCDGSTSAATTGTFTTPNV